MLHHTSNSAKFFFFLANCNTLYSSVNQVSVVDGFLAATEEFFLAYHVTVDLDGGPVLLVYRLDDSCLRFRLFLQQFGLFQTLLEKFLVFLVIKYILILNHHLISNIQI